jgi:hypothetical protein
MDATDVVDRVEADRQTELSRLGSSKSLYADTEGELNPDRVLAAMADGLHHAAAVLRNWAEDESGGPYGDAADRLDEHYETLEGELGGHDPNEAPAAAAALEGIADPDARLGALVGWAMVTDRKAGQVTGYFTGQADPSTASIVREFGEDYEAIRADAVDALGDGDAAVAAEAADSLVAAAYDEYVERLEAQGVNPKPVC